MRSLLKIIFMIERKSKLLIDKIFFQEVSFDMIYITVHNISR